MSRTSPLYAIRNTVATRLTGSETGFFLDDYVEKVPHKTSREFTTNRGFSNLVKFLNEHPRIETICLISSDGRCKYWVIDKERHERDKYPNGWSPQETPAQKLPIKEFVAKSDVKNVPALQLALEKAFDENKTKPISVAEEKEEMAAQKNVLTLSTVNHKAEVIPEGMDIAAMAALGQQLLDAAKKAETDKEQKKTMARIQTLQLEIAGATATILRLTDEQLTATMRLEKASNELKVLMGKII